MSVLVVGTLAFDSVQTPHGTRSNVLGGSGAFLSTAAAYHGPVQLAGVVGQDFPAAHFDFFAGRGVDVANVQRVEGATFRWRGHYTPDMNTAQTLETNLNVLKSFQPVLNEKARAAKYVVLGNFDPKLQLEVLAQVTQPTFVACDTMNYWIERHNGVLRQTLRQVDLLAVNEAEARALAGHQDLLTAASVIRAMGPKHVVIKRGEHGALLVHDGGVFATPAYSAAKVIDPTGAGDTFAGSLIGYLAHCNETSDIALRHAVAMGTVLASFTVEDFSLDRLRGVDVTDVRARAASFYSLVALEQARLLRSPAA